jgi:hypothetical protein
VALLPHLKALFGFIAHQFDVRLAIEFKRIVSATMIL